jgi:hypothetical protein
VELTDEDDDEAMQAEAEERLRDADAGEPVGANLKPGYNLRCLFKLIAKVFQVESDFALCTSDIRLGKSRGGAEASGCG